MTCSCKIEELLQKDFEICINTTFGCCHEKEAKYFVSSCKKCPFNCIMMGNYFSISSCFCLRIYKNACCQYCIDLRDHFNYHVNRICVKVKNLNQLPFEVVNLDKYLYDIKADPFCVFNNKFRIIDVKMDNPDYLDFFRKIQTD